MTDYNDGKWHGWNGGECPVHPKTVVHAVFAGGYPEATDAKEMPAWEVGDFCWRHDRQYRPVIAFRVVKEHREPREFWLTSCGVYHSKAAAMEANPPGEVVHVREVTE